MQKPNNKYSKITECCEFFYIKSIKIGSKYFEIWIFIIKPTESVSFDLKQPDTLYFNRNIYVYTKVLKRKAQNIL